MGARCSACATSAQRSGNSEEDEDDGSLDDIDECSALSPSKNREPPLEEQTSASAAHPSPLIVSPKIAEVRQSEKTAEASPRKERQSAADRLAASKKKAEDAAAAKRKELEAANIPPPDKHRDWHDAFQYTRDKEVSPILATAVDVTEEEKPPSVPEEVSSEEPLSPNTADRMEQLLSLHQETVEASSEEPLCSPNTEDRMEQLLSLHQETVEVSSEEPLSPNTADRMEQLLSLHQETVEADADGPHATFPEDYSPIQDLRCKLHERHVTSRQLFAMMDADRSNRITFGKFEQGMAMSGVRPVYSHTELRELFHSFDLDSDHSISSEEMVAALEAKERPPLTPLSPFSPVSFGLAEALTFIVDGAKVDFREKFTTGLAAISKDNPLLTTSSMTRECLMSEVLEAIAMEYRAKGIGFTEQQLVQIKDGVPLTEEEKMFFEIDLPQESTA